jgi:dTMP kinase
MQYHLSLDINLKKNPFPGLYIALEGIDGSGKTTQSNALKEYFISQGKTVTQTSEPRIDLPGGDLIIQFFQGEVAVSGQAFQYWMSANRVINHDTIVLPALQRGEVVISDRCFWSAVPYGLMDNGVSFSRTDAEIMMVTQGLLSHYYQFIAPDIVFYIDISSKIGLERSLRKKGRREQDVYEKKDKLAKVVKGYRWLIKEFPEEFASIDGEGTVQNITEEIINNLGGLRSKSPK